jgi:hypothetical protein
MKSSAPVIGVRSVGLCTAIRSSHESAADGQPHPAPTGVGSAAHARSSRLCRRRLTSTCSIRGALRRYHLPELLATLHEGVLPSLSAEVVHDRVDLRGISVSADSFDFWLGTWVVSWDGEGGQVEAGVNSVTRVDDTIREIFTAPDPAGAYIGASVSRWDADAECWRQDYWDNRGYSAIFQGSRSADRMILERIPGPGPGPLTRLVWSDIAPAAILWNYERQNADGSWESTWRIRYARQETGGASATR